MASRTNTKGLPMRPEDFCRHLVAEVQRVVAVLAMSVAGLEGIGGPRLQRQAIEQPYRLGRETWDVVLPLLAQAVEALEVEPVTAPARDPHLVAARTDASFQQFLADQCLRDESGA